MVKWWRILTTRADHAPLSIDRCEFKIALAYSSTFKCRFSISFISIERQSCVTIAMARLDFPNAAQYTVTVCETAILKSIVQVCSIHTTSEIRHLSFHNRQRRNGGTEKVPSRHDSQIPQSARPQAHHARCRRVGVSRLRAFHDRVSCPFNGIAAVHTEYLLTSDRTA